MNYKNLLMFICAAVLMASRCDGQSDIAKVEFTSLTRGYQKQVFLDKDSVKIIVDGRQEENKVMNRAMPDGAWKDLLVTLKNIELAKLPGYKSPTNRRAFDGAKHSTITVTKTDGTTYSHGFDDINPHAKLKPLLDRILEIENAEKP
jgi:hypothetical protein